MIKKIYTLYDIKIECYHFPFFGITDAEAKRTISASASTEQSLLGKYPEDYTLYSIGEYDDETAGIKNTEKVYLGTVKEILTESGILPRNR